jgi:hypothetical protein
LKNSGQTLVEKNKPDLVRKISIDPSAPVCKSQTDQSNLAGKISSEFCCKISSGLFQKLFYRALAQKIFKPSSGRKILNKSHKFTPPKTSYF